MTVHRGRSSCHIWQHCACYVPICSHCREGEDAPKGLLLLLLCWFCCFLSSPALLIGLKINKIMLLFQHLTHHSPKQKKPLCYNPPAKQTNNPYLLFIYFLERRFQACSWVDGFQGKAARMDFCHPIPQLLCSHPHSPRIRKLQSDQLRQF